MELNFPFVLLFKLKGKHYLNYSNQFFTHNLFIENAASYINIKTSLSKPTTDLNRSD